MGNFSPDELRGWSFGGRVEHVDLFGVIKKLDGPFDCRAFYGRGGMQGCGPDFGPLWDVAWVRSGSCDRFRPKPCREPVDHLGKGDACFAVTVKARLVLVQFFDHRGRERDQVKAKAGVDFFEFIIKEFEQVVRVAAGFRCGHADFAHFTVGPKDHDANPPCAKAGLCHLRAKGLAECGQVRLWVLHRFGQVCLNAKARWFLGRADRFGQLPQHLIEPHQRFLRKCGPTKSPRERDARHGNQIGHGFQP